MWPKMRTTYVSPTHSPNLGHLHTDREGERDNREGGGGGGGGGGGLKTMLYICITQTLDGERDR